MAQCGNCGKEMNEDAIFCDNCGSAALPVSATGDTVEAPSFYSAPPVEDESEAQEAVADDVAQPKKKRSKTPLIVVLCVLFAAALAVGGLYLMNNPPAFSTHGNEPATTPEWTMPSTAAPVRATEPPTFYSTTEPANLDQLIGLYQGNYKAADGLYWGVTLRVQKTIYGDYEAFFDCYASTLQTYPDSFDKGPGSWRGNVEYDAASDTFSIIAREWINQPYDWAMDSFYECELLDYGKILVGIVDSATYGGRGESFEIYKLAADGNTQPMPNAPNAVSIPTTGYRVVFEEDHNLHIRTGPSEDFTIIGKIPRNSIITATSMCDGWAYVTYDGITGWSSMKYLLKVD